jgi:hypothetical protein
MWPWAFRFAERDVDAEHAARTFAKFGDGHRHFLDGWPEFDGAEQRPARFELGIDHSAAIEPAVAEWDPTESRNVEAAVVPAELLGNVHMGEPADHRRRGAGEVNAQRLADRAVSAVGADQVPGDDVVIALRRRHRQRNGFRPWLQADEFVSPAQIHSEIACPLFQQPHQSGLRHEHRVHRVVGQAEEVQRHGGEYPSVTRLGRTVVAGERLIEAAHV